MPLVFRICVNLYYKIWRHVWYPLQSLWRNAFYIAIAIICGWAVFTFLSSDPEPMYGRSKPQTAAVPEQPARQKPRDNPSTYDDRPVPPALPTDHAPEGPIDPIMKEEDGNSVFSSDLIPKMNSHELRFYSQQFYYAMDNSADNERYRWNFHNIHGVVFPTKTFTNNLGQTCRHFGELLKVHDTRQNISGIACQKKGGGWCKLRPTSTPACDLGRKTGIGTWWMDTKRSITDLFR